ncbi:MAG: DUF3267 domain-containing protein [Armatimonadetes bacterium]|nr:DUF3267 domain-containing protein [Armatimonadota bacterium]
MGGKNTTYGAGWANVIGIPVAGLAFALCLVPHGLLWGWPSVSRGAALLFSPLTFLIVVLVGALAHEGLHALGFRVFGGAPWAQIRFRVLWRALTPATHCHAAVRAGAYRWATALPGLVLGVLPGAAGILSGAGWLTLFAAVMLSLAAGDLLVLLAIRHIPAATWVIDHPSRVGCQIVREASGC